MGADRVGRKDYSCAPVLGRLRMRSQNWKSSKVTPMLLPGHRCSPALRGNKAHLSLLKLCTRWVAFPLHVRLMEFFSRSVASTFRWRAAQSEQTSATRRSGFLESDRAERSNCMCPLSPHSTHLYRSTSRGVKPSAKHGMQTRSRPCDAAWPNTFLLKSTAMRCCLHASHCHLLTLLVHFMQRAASWWKARTSL